MSLCSSAQFSLQVWSPTLLRINSLHSALDSSDHCLANCSLVASLTITPVSLFLVLNIGAVALPMFSVPLRVSHAG